MPAFFRTLEKIKPVYDWAYKIMLFICKLLLIADEKHDFVSPVIDRLDFLKRAEKSRHKKPLS